MDEQRLESCLRTLEHDLETYEDETTITYTSFLMHQVHTVITMVFCVDTGAPHSWIGGKALERIFSHSGRVSIPIIDSKQDFRFGYTLVSSRGAVELILHISVSMIYIPIVLDVLDAA